MIVLGASLSYWGDSGVVEIASNHEIVLGPRIGRLEEVIDRLFDVLALRVRIKLLQVGTHRSSPALAEVFFVEEEACTDVSLSNLKVG